MLFTVLTACHNHSRYIEDTICSVIAQDYPDWEMIVIDDHSKDNTFQAAEKVARGHNNITVLRNNPRLYCGGTYNRMIKLATGKICGVLDGDDQLLKNSISTIVSYYKKYPQLDFIWTNHYWYNSKMIKHRKGISNIPKAGTIYDSEKGLRHIYSHWRTFKTDLRDKAQLFDPKLKCTVDKNLGYILEEVGRGGYLDKMMYKYRYHPDNMSHHSNQKGQWHKIRIEHKRKRRIKSIILT